jgi:hypothetical protein
MRRLTMILVALVLLGSACGDDSAGGEADGSAGSSYDTLTALNDDLAAAGITCELEYEGLKDDEREISQCVINEEPTTLNIWFNDELRQAIVDESGDTVAFGANWTVQVATPETAQQIADALDGSTGTAGPTDTAG